MSRDTAPFPWDELPRTTRRLADASALGARLLAVEFGDALEEIRKSLSEMEVGLDDAELAAVAVHDGATFSPNLGDAAATNMRWPGHRVAGAVTVERSLVGVVVGGLLGAGESIDGPLDDYDFGLFTFALLRAVRSLEQVGFPPLVVDVERRPSRRVTEDVMGRHPVHEFAFEVTLDGIGGWVRVFLPGPLRATLQERAGYRPIRPEALSATAAGRVPLRLDVGVGRVMLSGSELRTLSPGDVVFLTQQALEEFGASAPGRLWIAPDAWIDGELAYDDHWTIVLNDLTPRLSEDMTMDDSSAPNSAETTQLVKKASVSCEAVVGRVELSLDHLARLKPGETLVCDGPVGQPVDLVANGTTIASGELVDIEGTLGVRILSLTR